MWFDEWGSWDPYSSIVSEDDKDIEELLLVYGLIFGGYRRQRKIKFQHIRADWDCHVGMLEYTDQFEQRFWMSQKMFYDLVDELRVPLTVSYIQSMRSTSGNNPNLS